MADTPLTEYEVIAGKHHDADGNTFCKGERFTTALNLDHFKNKFRKIVRDVVQVVVEEGKTLVEELVQESSKDILKKVEESTPPADPVVAPVPEVKPEPPKAEVKKPFGRK